MSGRTGKRGGATPEGDVVFWTNYYTFGPGRRRRGRCDLGLWLVAETIHRMLPTGIVLMWPYPVLTTDSVLGTDPDADPDPDPVRIAALDNAIGRLSDHFGRCGLTPVESAPWALGMSTTFEALPVARSHLGAVRRTTVSFTLDQLRAASPPPDE
nr:hypothetical protein [Rhodococcus wratislaviensis]